VINVLVPTKPDDSHAIYVKLALEAAGHSAHLWFTADYPSRQSHSFQMANNDLIWTMKNTGDELTHFQADIVWFRRPCRPILPNILHEDDIENAKKENGMLYQTLWQVIMPDATWINPPDSAYKANSKLLQLKIANNLGMKIPNTLISNDPFDIKKFINQKNGKVVYKTLYPMTWISDSEIRLTYTSPISIDDLPADNILQLSPGIFQNLITKNYELRVTYFGVHYIAVKIDSQAHDQAQLDWRSAPTYELILEQVMLPDKLDQLCQQFMKELNIVFGCFDFIVTPEGEYYFLEINEQGQFLWIEEVNPEIKMLQTFIQFLNSFDQIKNKPNLKCDLSDFSSEMLMLKDNLEKNHLNPDCKIYA